MEDSMNQILNKSANQRLVFEKIKKVMETSIKKYLSLQLNVANMNAIIKDIIANLTIEVPDFKSYIESITYKIDPVTKAGHIMITYNQATLQKYGVKDLKVKIS